MAEGEITVKFSDKLKSVFKEINDSWIDVNKKFGDLKAITDGLRNQNKTLLEAIIQINNKLIDYEKRIEKLEASNNIHHGKLGGH